ILVIGSGFFTIFYILATVISSSDSPFKSAILSGSGVLISSLLCLLFIPLFGLKGAALSTTLAAFIVMLLAFVIVYKKFQVFYSLKSTLKILTASLIIY